MSPHILLTGPQDIGKTTICKKVISILEERGISYDGYHSQEMRDRNFYRISFDIVRARKFDFSSSMKLRGKNYTADEVSKPHPLNNYERDFQNEFDSRALPTLDSDVSILIMDEIGKMELLSKDFKKKIMDIFFDPPKKVSVLGIIPHKVPDRHHLALFKKLYTDENIRILNVSHKNRNNLPQEIVRYFEIYKKVTSNKVIGWNVVLLLIMLVCICAMYFL